MQIDLSVHSQYLMIRVALLSPVLEVRGWRAGDTFLTGKFLSCFQADKVRAENSSRICGFSIAFSSK